MVGTRTTRAEESYRKTETVSITASIHMVCGAARSQQHREDFTSFCQRISKETFLILLCNTLYPIIWTMQLYITAHCSCDVRAKFWEVSQAAPAVQLHSVVGWDQGEQGRTSRGVSSAGYSAVQSGKEPTVPAAQCKGQLTGQSSLKGVPEE